MPIIETTDSSDPRLDEYCNLNLRKQGQPADTFVVEGAWLVERLARSPFELVSVLVGINQTTKALEIIEQHAGSDVAQRIPVYSLKTPKISQLLGFQFHRGMMACARRQQMPPREALLEIPNGEDKSIVVVLPRIANETNLGGIMRIGAAFGVTGFLMSDRGGDPFSRRSMRLSMGCALSLPVRVSNQFSADFEWLQSVGETTMIASVVCDSDEQEAIHSRIAPARAVGDGLLSMSQRIGLVLGAEDYGIPQTLVDRCAHCVTIPMHGGTDSLNVSMAAGILLHELRRT